MILPFNNKDLTGTVLEKRYEITRKLSGGGFGETYLAKDRDNNNQECVVKRLKPQGNFNKYEFRKIKELFEKEAKHLNRLEHPQIPQLKDYIVVKERFGFIVKQEFYIVQEYIEGQELRNELTHGEQKDDNYVWQLLHDILKVVSFVHEQKLVHRDIKPDNLIRRENDNQLVLIDFGSVKDMSESKVRKSTIIIGTDPYMPMEQKQGDISFYTDIYAVGMIGVEALTGKVPHVRNIGIGADENDKIIWREYAPNVSNTLADFIDKMIDPRPHLRYNNGGIALKALREIAPVPINLPNDNNHPIVVVEPVFENDNNNNSNHPILKTPNFVLVSQMINTVLILPEIYTIDITPESDNNKVIYSNILSHKLLSHKLVIIPAGIATALAFAFIGFQVVNSLKKPDISKEELTQTYSHPETGMNFTIKYSEQWIAKPETLESSEKIKFTRKDKVQTDNCPVEIMVSIDDLGKALTIEEHKKDVLQNIQNDDANTLERADEIVNLDGTEAYQIRWKRQENGCTFKKLERGTMALKKAYYITYQAPVDDNEKFWPMVEKMIDSFDIQEGN
ncbi:MAG: protein kinase domain-containing protein [Dolichospermum sp.]